MSNKWGPITDGPTGTPTLAHSTLHRPIENETPLSLSGFSRDTQNLMVEDSEKDVKNVIEV
uniref:Uncharacterized protein n=1 Tax=Solanum lycopersicum TaxID=4081 RepID=A0A3Q7I0C5_SOLLC